MDRGEQRAVELRSRHEDDGDGEGRLARGSLDAAARSQQLRPAPRHRLHARGSHGDARRLRHQLRALPSRRRRQRAADQRPAGDQRRRRADADGEHVPDDAAGLSGGPDGSDALQSAAGQHHLHAERLSLERRAQLVRVGAARDLGRRAARPRLRRQSRQRHAAVRELQPGGAEQRRRHAVAAVAPPDSRVRRHHLLVQRRQVALPLVPDQVRLAHRPTT